MDVHAVPLLGLFLFRRRDEPTASLSTGGVRHAGTQVRQWPRSVISPSDDPVDWV